MSLLLIPPISLQADVQFQDAIPLINSNFNEVEATFKGFAVEDQLAFPDNTGGVGLSAGALAVDFSSIEASSPTDAIVFAAPRLSVFIDSPPVMDPKATTYDLNYLYPTGSALTVGQKRLLVGMYIGISDIAGNSSFTGFNGKTYYYRNYLSISLRNADNVFHSYYLLINQSVYSSAFNQFR